MGITNPTDIADSQFDASVKSLIVHQSLATSPPDVKADIHNHHHSANKAKAQDVYANLNISAS